MNCANQHYLNKKIEKYINIFVLKNWHKIIISAYDTLTQTGLKKNCFLDRKISKYLS